MGLVILFVMIGVPIAEIMAFIEVGGYLGLWPTIGVVILTAIIGTGLLKWQGLATLYSAQESLLQNRFPLDEVFDGLCLILAGALLLTPGFITGYRNGGTEMLHTARSFAGASGGMLITPDGQLCGIHTKTYLPGSPLYPNNAGTPSSLILHLVDIHGR